VTAQSSNGTVNKTGEALGAHKKLVSSGEGSESGKSLAIAQWVSAWKTWLDIGNKLLGVCSSGGNNGSSGSKLAGSGEAVAQPGQTFLTCFIDLVSVIVEKLAPAGKFTPKDFESYSRITDKLLSIPVLSSDYSSFIMMQVDNSLTPLQNSSLNTITSFIKVSV